MRMLYHAPMANVLLFFMNPEDERAFLRFLARYPLELYPIRVPPDWKPPKVDEQALPLLPEDAAYFAARELGPVIVDRVKRGPSRGSWRIDEVRSPVLYFERSRQNDDDHTLLSGRLWAELDVTPQTGRRNAAPDRFRQLFGEIEAHLKSYRRSEPKGYWIGPAAARQFKEGLILQDAEPGGPRVRPFR
jgi:hypothetical protein